VRGVVRVVIVCFASGRKRDVHADHVAGGEGSTIRSKARQSDLLTGLVAITVAVTVQADRAIEWGLSSSPPEPHVAAFTPPAVVVVRELAGAQLDLDLHVPSTFADGGVATDASKALITQDTKAVGSQLHKWTAILPADTEAGWRALDGATGQGRAGRGDASWGIAEAKAIQGELLGCVVRGSF